MAAALTSPMDTRGNHHADRLAVAGARLHALEESEVASYHSYTRRVALGQALMLKIWLSRVALHGDPDDSVGPFSTSSPAPAADVPVPPAPSLPTAPQFDPQEASATQRRGMKRAPLQPDPSPGAVRTRFLGKTLVPGGFTAPDKAQRILDSPETRYPRFPWGRPADSASSSSVRHRVALGPAPKKLGVQLKFNKEDGFDTQWLYPHSHFEAAHWYFDRLEWELSPDLSVTWIELVLDFWGATGVVVESSTRTAEGQIATMAELFASMSRRVAVLTRTPVTMGTSQVVGLHTLGLGQYPGFNGARPVFRCREFVEACLFKRATSWTDGRPSPRSMEVVDPSASPSSVVDSSSCTVGQGRSHRAPSQSRLRRVAAPDVCPRGQSERGTQAPAQFDSKHSWRARLTGFS